MERLSVLPFRKEGAAGPTDDQWAQAQTRARAAGVKFAAMVCEDDDGALFVVAVNTESDVHLRAMIETAVDLFTEESDG